MEKHCSREVSNSKKKTINYWFLVTLLLGTAFVGFAPSAIAMSAFIEVLQGEAQIQRGEGQEYVPAAEGNEILTDYLLLPAEDAEVKVRCNDSERSLREVDAGIPSGLSLICPNFNPNTGSRGINGIFYALLRGEFSPQTALFPEDITLRWPAVSGATSYRLWLAQKNEVLWQREVNDTQIVYDGSPLKPGTNYRLVVIPNDIPPTTVYQLGLKLLSQRQQEIIEAEVLRLEQLGATPTATALMLSDYLSKPLDSSFTPAAYLAAIAPLENLAQNTNNAVIHRSLGDIYLRLGWFGEAEQSYTKSLRIGLRSRNIEEKAKARFGLAHVYLARRDLEKSQQWLIEAQEDYQSAGNSDQVEMISELLKTLTILMSGG